MTTALAKTNSAAVTKPGALAVMAGRLNVDPAKLLETLKATVFQKASNEELLALTVVANEYDLNPFLKEIYAFPAKGGGIVPIVSVDGWNKMLIRQPDFDGIEFEFEHAEGGGLISCTATIFVKNRTRPVKITEYFDECKRNTDPWNNMPHRMLRNRTLCQASRVAFGFSGVQHEDEAVITVESTTLPPKKIAAKSADAPTEGAARTVQQEVEILATSNGYTFDHVQKFGTESGILPTGDSATCFDELPKDYCIRVLRATAEFLDGLRRIKEAM